MAKKVKEEEAEVVEPKKEPCQFCAEEYVIPTAWGDGGIIEWVNLPAVVCPVCCRPIKG